MSPENRPVSLGDLTARGDHGFHDQTLHVVQGNISPIHARVSQRHRNDSPHLRGCGMDRSPSNFAPYRLGYGSLGLPGPSQRRTGPAHGGVVTGRTASCQLITSHGFLCLSFPTRWFARSVSAYRCDSSRRCRVHAFLRFRRRPFDCDRPAAAPEKRRDVSTRAPSVSFRRFAAKISSLISCVCRANFQAACKSAGHLLSCFPDTPIFQAFSRHPQAFSRHP